MKKKYFLTVGRSKLRSDAVFIFLYNLRNNHNTMLDLVRINLSIFRQTVALKTICFSNSLEFERDEKIYK